jgi:hypothetical protein
MMEGWRCHRLVPSYSCCFNFVGGSNKGTRKKKEKQPEKNEFCYRMVRRWQTAFEWPAREEEKSLTCEWKRDKVVIVAAERWGKWKIRFIIGSTS